MLYLKIIMDSPKDKHNNQEVHSEEANILSKESNDEFEFRFLERDDYKKGFLDVLAQLTVVGEIW